MIPEPNSVFSNNISIILWNADIILAAGNHFYVMTKQGTLSKLIDIGTIFEDLCLKSVIIRVPFIQKTFTCKQNPKTCNQILQHVSIIF